MIRASSAARLQAPAVLFMLVGIIARCGEAVGDNFGLVQLFGVVMTQKTLNSRAKR